MTDSRERHDPGAVQGTLPAAGAVAGGPVVHPDGLPAPRRYWAIATIVLAIVMSVLDSTLVNVALPTMGRDFGVSEAATIWIVNAYQLAILVALLPLSSLGEIVGYRRVSQAGMLVFTLASLACALSPSLLTLSLARILQGLGAAGIMSVNAALVRHTYPQAMLGRAVGINAFFIATAAAIGPSIASAVLAVAHWRWLFAINVPIGLITLLIAGFALPHTERHPRRLNVLGALLNAGAFGLLISGLQAFAHDEAWRLALLQIVAGCVVGWLLVRHERPRSSPLIPFDLLRIRLFRLSVLTSVCSFTAQMAALVALPFALQHLGRSAVETGLLMTPWPLGVALSAPIAGHLTDRHPAGLMGGIGLAVNALGLALLASLPADSLALLLILGMALCGLGFGCFQAPNNRAILSAAPRSRSGAAGGVLSSARLIGQSTGAAGVAVLFRVCGAAGPTAVLAVSAVIAVLAAGVSLIRLRAGSGDSP